MRLANRFDGFEEELHLSRHKKKQDDDRKIIALQTQINNLRDSLTLESKNRGLSIKALQSWLEDRITQWAKEVELPLTQRIDNLTGDLDKVTIRVTNVENEHKRDRETFPRLIEQRSIELLTEIRDFKKTYEQEIKSREEKDKRIFTKIQDLGLRLRQQLVAEKTLNDQKMQEVRQELAAEVDIRAKGYEMLHKTVSEEVDELKAMLRKESQARVAADEELVQAVNHYAAALQDGVKIVSTQ